MQTLPPITGIATIGDVIAAIERILEWSVGNASRLGYFAALYKRITVSIGKNLPEFENPARMEKLDVGTIIRILNAQAERVAHAG